MRKLSIVVFEPLWGEDSEVDSRHPLQFGEHVIYLGNIPNCPGHCVVAKFSGEVVPMVHPQDFREATEEEI